jgi:alkylation response protein AidB-like acyl-CoA dehydrogenase
MDFAFSDQHEALRAEVRAWLAEHYPDGFGPAESFISDVPSDEAWTVARQLAKNLAAKRWLAPTWPREYGGAAMNTMDYFVLKRELALHGAPLTGTEAAVDVLGPVFLQWMTDEQKAQHLTAIAAGDESWCQGYSEPEAGSDLASLRTSAVRDGDEYVVNGTKIWTSFGHRADWILLLVRTDPDVAKWAGISMLMTEVRTRGITVQPIENLLGQVTFNQVFLDDVRIPVENRVGDENQGWKLVTQSLESERSSIGSMAKTDRMLRGLVAHAQQPRPQRDGRSIDRPDVRRRLADLRIGSEVGYLMACRVASSTLKRREIGYEASMAKVFGTELEVAIGRDAVSILGTAGQLSADEPMAPFAGRMAESHLFSRVMTIGGGTNEIQRDIIARRGLGLPRS